MLNLKQDAVRSPVPRTDCPVQEFPAMETLFVALSPDFSICSSSSCLVAVLIKSFDPYVRKISVQRGWFSKKECWINPWRGPVVPGAGTRQPAGEGKWGEMSAEEGNRQLIRPLSSSQLT